VRIYQVGEDRGVPYIAMEFLKGEALDQRIKRGQFLTLKQVVRIGKEAALGLAAAHKHNLVHRDIKPANLWLEADTDRVKVLDFGLARAASGDNANITQSGAIIGTPAYMAPEQANGKKVDGRTDLFSLGCVLYQMCTGQQPFRGTDTVSTLVEVATHDPKPPAEIDPTVPRPLSRLIMKLLAKAPADRASSTAEVAEVLAEMETSQEITDEPRSRNRAIPKGDLAPTGTLLESRKPPSKSLRDSIADADEDVVEAARKPRRKADTLSTEMARPSRRKKQREAASNPMLLWGIIGGGVALVLVVGLVIGAIVLANSGKGSSSSSTSVAQSSASQSPGSAGPANGNSSPPASKSSGPGTPVIPLPHISWDEPVFFLFKGSSDPGPADVRLKSFMSLPPLPKEVTFVSAKVGQRVWTDPNKDFALSKLTPELNDTILLWHGVGFCRTWMEGADMTALQDCSVFAVVRIHDGISLKVPNQKLTQLAAAGWTETNLVADTTTEHDQIWQWKVLVKTLRKGDSIGNLP
jgi:serine/threonine protein kinase